MRRTNDIKIKNTLDIVRAIRSSGPVSKPQIAERLGLTGVTVHNFINELVSSRLVVENGIAGSNGGRKAVLYSLNQSYGYIIGQDLGTDSINTYIFDLNLKLLHKAGFSCSLDYSQKILDIMADGVKKALAAAGIKPGDCLGTGVSIPGQVDYKEGVVKNIPHLLGWRNIPVRSCLEQRTGIRTFVDNDTNNYALVSKWTGVVPQDADSVALSMSRGVGAGFLTNGEVFRGAHSNAGEIGHTTIQYDGPRCKCGNRGCLDIMLSDATLLDKVKLLPGMKKENVDIDLIVKMAEAKNEGVCRVLKETAGYVSIAIDHLSKTYDPGYIVVYSDWLTELQDLNYMIIDSVFERTSWITREDLQIKFASKGEYECYCGAVSVLEDLFSYKDNNLLIERLKS